MSHFYESMKNLLCHSMVNKAAATVDEEPERIEKAISAILSSLLAMYLKTHNPHVNNILREAGNLGIIKDIDNICNGTPDEEQRYISDSFLQEMLGDNAVNFTAPIARLAGISNVATNQVIYMVAPVVAGYLGDKLTNGQWNDAQLLEEIRRSKGSFVGDIPVGIVNAFDLSYIIRTDTKGAKNSNTWIWVIMIIFILILAFFGWKSCKDGRPIATSRVSSGITSSIAPAVIDYIDIILPDGRA